MKDEILSKLKKVLLYTLAAVIVPVSIIAGCRSSSRPPTENPQTDGQPQPDDTVIKSPSGGPDDLNGENGYYEITEISKGDFRAVWVASVLNLDFPSRRDLNSMALKREIDHIVSRSAEMGLNAIIFQVRPTGDSFYESEFFPWSRWLSGTQGQGIPDFDPLAYWIEASHEKGLELHAWLNPYRIIHTSTNSSDPNTLSPDNPVRINPDLAVGWTNRSGNSGLFLDPGLPEARQLIIDGIIEVATKYDIDGIHIDDYFYPGTDFNDAATFDRFGNGMELADWRRENVNTLIQEIQVAIKNINNEHNKNIRWGISPSAIWKNTESDPVLGVDVPSTFESYHLLYADTRKWVMEEWVDYINPQIYWYIGFPTADFETILNWWVDLCKDYNVDLYIGHAAYREDENDQPPHWEGEIIRQLEKLENTEEVTGSVFYRFHSLRGSLGNTIRDFFRDEEPVEREPVMISDKLSIGMPAQDVTIVGNDSNASGFNIVGTSIPDIPLYMNGEEVTNRTIEGFFFIFAPLSSGVNEFIFSQESQEDVIRTVTRNSSGGGGGGGGGGGSVTQVTTPRYATINTDDAWVFTGNSLTGGSDWMLVRGQRDRITAESTNNFVKLSCGMWVSKNAVTIRNENALTENVLKNGIYRRDTNYDRLIWKSDVFPAVHAEYDGTILRINFGMHTEAPPLSLPSDLSETIFSSFSRGVDNSIPYFEFTVRNDVNFEGFYVEHTGDEFIFNLKKRKPLARGAYPLTDIIILLDPGHGGQYSGALGALGHDLAEKDLNLINTFKLAERLEALGATVHLTRDEDVDISLQGRVDISRKLKPDLFISLHINSVAETTNATNIRGFTVYYRNPNSVNISQTMLNVLYDIIPETNRHRSINQANFFVCRPVWTPSVLLEAGFIINIHDFVLLIDPVHQDAMAERTVNAVLEYFAG